MSKSSIQRKVPYFSQWESPELVEKLLDKSITALQDPRWMDSGAATPEEYELWSWNICGLACFKMILKAERKVTYKTMTLVKKALEYKCLDTEKGLYYKPFCKMVREEFKLEAHFTERLTPEKIRHEIRKGNYVIASVHGSIRSEDLAFEPPHKGGHLILINGFDQNKKTFIFHDSSGFYNRTQQYRTVLEKDFLRFSSQRGVIIYRTNEPKKN